MFNIDERITALYQWLCSFKGKALLRDTTKLPTVKFDAYVESTMIEPLSFTIFELSAQGELIIDDTSRLMASTAAFYLFVNSKTGWVFAVKNTLENQKKLIRKEPIQNFKIKIVE